MNTTQKPFKTIDEQIEILRSRGLVISEVDETRKKLLNNNYYTVVNGYKYPFLQNKDRNNEQFFSGTSFEELFALYKFDCDLRALLLKNILIIEHQLKSVISHKFAEKHCNESFPSYLSEKNFDIDKNGKLPPKKQSFFDDFKEHVYKELEHQESNHNQMLEHYKKEYNNIPPWILVSFLSFGMTRIFYYCLGNKDQNDIARVFGLYPKDMNAYLSVLNIYRNACAHDERIYNLHLINRITRQEKEYSKIYVLILILKDMLDSSSFMAFYSELDTIIGHLERKLKTIDISVILDAMGMPLSPAVRKAELGPLERGNALSAEEFKEVLVRYVIPTLPITVNIQRVEPNDTNRENKKCKLIEQKGSYIYFSQSTTTDFSYRVPVQDIFIDDGQLSIMQDHLAVFIDYIHVFWNLSNMSAYGREKIEIAFPLLCEQAYELAICNLLSRGSAQIVKKEYEKAISDYRKKEGTIPAQEKLPLIDTIRECQHALDSAIDLENTALKNLYGILTQFETWASRTYEGQKKTFGILFSKDELPSDKAMFNYIDFLKTDYSATINDGIYSAVELFADGSFKAHLSIKDSGGLILPSIPYPFSGFAALCTGSKIGILLTDHGDILIISDQKLRYTKHNGRWIRSMSEKAIHQIKNELQLTDDRANIIYQAITDVSYSRGGACIGIINEDTLPQRLREMVQAGLLSEVKDDHKLVALQSIISSNEKHENFYELNRYLRRELLELDGAMVLSKNGQIHVIGTIIKLDGSGSDGGGRTAAAKQLSEFGLSIKISQDGYVQFFRNKNAILEILT